MKKNFEVTLKQMITVIHKTINSVDKRLLNHGEQVAYIMFNLLKADGNYNEEEMLRLCAVSTFHDIGAYKVTELDKLTEIDTVSPLNHAVYGSLFIKYFSPLSDLYNVVLNHHFSEKYAEDNNIKSVCKEGILLAFADYLDRLYLNNQQMNKSYIEEKCKDDYSNKYINLFFIANQKFNVIEKLKDGTYVKELYEFFGQKIITREEVIAYSKMLAYSIDFRSEATVKHTITVEAISYQIAKLYGLDEEDLTRIKIAADLHDIGKIGIPVEILEKQGKLTKEEFEIMQSHAIIGYNILSDLNIDDIRDIGTLHHEKLDGTGYPFGLKGNELTIEMRIVAIGDIISALLGSRSYKEEFDKDKIIKILKNMVQSNKIDSGIVTLFINNYDYIIEEAKKQWSDLMKIYLNLNNEYNEILESFV